MQLALEVKLLITVRNLILYREISKFALIEDASYKNTRWINLQSCLDSWSIQTFFTFTQFNKTNQNYKWNKKNPGAATGSTDQRYTHIQRLNDESLSLYNIDVNINDIILHLYVEYVQRYIQNSCFVATLCILHFLIKCFSFPITQCQHSLIHK